MKSTEYYPTTGDNKEISLFPIYYDYSKHRSDERASPGIGWPTVTDRVNCCPRLHENNQKAPLLPLPEDWPFIYILIKYLIEIQLIRTQFSQDP